jgi:tRNA dimethylallyltransferase
MDKHRLLLSIVGLTATGKTDLALFLATKLIEKKIVAGVKIISADSKQVYRGLAILTGADIPIEFSPQKPSCPSAKYCYFSRSQQPIEIHGVSIITQEQKWSVAHFRDLAITQINSAWQKKWFAIIVGGTGFYHQQLLVPDESVYVKPNRLIRTKADKLSIGELQNWLQQLDPLKLGQLNSSDINNSRRLVRAIEIAQHHQQPVSLQPPAFTAQLGKPFEYLSLGVTANQPHLKQQIKKRVKQRIAAGAVQEVATLLDNQSATLPAMAATGVCSIQSFLKHHSTVRLEKEWTAEEVAYSKKQLTWFKKFAPHHWLDVGDRKIQSQALKLLEEHLTGIT